METFANNSFFISTEQQPLVSQGLLIKRLDDHMQTHHTR